MIPNVEPTDQDVNSIEQQVAAYLESKGIAIDCTSIEACHLLPKRRADAKQSVIMRFVNRKHKIALLKQGRKLKGTNVFINEHLTKPNAEIAWKARNLKNKGKYKAHGHQTAKYLLS